MASQWLTREICNRYVTGFLFLTYSLFMLGYFLVPNAVDLYKFYSVAVFVPGILIVAHALRLLSNNRLFLLLVLYITYMLTTYAWGDASGIKPFLVYLRLALYVVMFFFVTVVIHDVYPKAFVRLLRVLCIFAAISALISVVVWFQGGLDFEGRIVGIGITKHPNASAFIYGFFAVLSVVVAAEEKVWRRRILYLLAASILVYFVWLTQSRGGMVALLVAFTVLFFMKYPKRTVLSLALVAVSAAFVYLAFPEVLSSVFRGTSNRPEIWEALLAKVPEAPIFGHGWLTDQRVYVEVQKEHHAFAHSAYLGTLREGGAVGLLLLLAPLAYAGWWALRLGIQENDYRYLALLVFGLSCAVFDLDRLIVRPGVIWIIIWLPLALIMTQIRLVSMSIADNEAITDSPGKFAQFSDSKAYCRGNGENQDTMVQRRPIHR